MKTELGILVTSFSIALPLDMLADPVASYYIQNGNPIVTIANPEPIPFYCKFRYTDGTVERKILYTGQSMQQDRWRELKEGEEGRDCT
jgi:hypothetical protein